MKNRYLLPLAIAMSLLLSGCGNSSSDTNTTTGTNQNQVGESEISVQLSGKTFYFVGDDAQKVDSIVFNKELTSFTATDNNTPVATTLNGNQLNQANNVAFTLQETTEDYLLINYLESDKVIDTFRLYFEKSKAEEYLATLNKVLSGLIIGTTQYTINSNGVLSDKVIKEDGVFTENVTLANGNNFNAVGTYTIKDKILTLTRDTGVVIVATYLEHSSEYITLSASLNGKEAFKSYWFLTAEARDTKGKELIK